MTFAIYNHGRATAHQGEIMTKTIYAAPLEGLTGFVWRKAHAQVFGGVDKYYTPFIAPKQNKELPSRELRDITQGEEHLVPQILTSSAELMIGTSKLLHNMGYEEVNLNLGCPSGTVVAKGKGSGALRDLTKLDEFLYEVYENLPEINVSIKTRIGVNSVDEWPGILEVFEKYPISELTVHPRLKVELYKGRADRELFKALQKDTKLMLAYNGDVRTPDDEAFDYGCPVMIGRGLIANPALARMARGGAKASREELREYHDIQIEGYRTYMSGDTPLLHRMKEFWHHFEGLYDVTDQQMKKLYKAKKYHEYEAVANAVMDRAELR